MKNKLRIILFIITSFLFVGCSMGAANGDSSKSLQVDKPVGSLEVKYAKGFSVDYYEEGYTHIHVMDGSDYIIVPEGKEKRDFDLHNAIYIDKELDNIYLAASSAMDLFKELDELGRIKECSTKATDYSDPIIANMIENNDIIYVGKYSSPDVETLLANNCQLAIESTMITHTPKIKEQLEGLGIAVFTEYSSYEENPLGRLEWIKVYGLLTGRLDEANDFFLEECKKVDEITGALNSTKSKRPSVAFFYISSNGYVNVRKPGDYFSKMIDLAGGEYALSGLELDEDNALSTVNITLEDFYKEGKDADILIYNSTVAGRIDSLDDLVEKSQIFQDFKAVKEDRVYCSTLNLFQDSSKVADIINSLHKIVTTGEDEEKYFIKIQ